MTISVKETIGDTGKGKASVGQGPSDIRHFEALILLLVPTLQSLLSSISLSLKLSASAQLVFEHLVRVHEAGLLSPARKHALWMEKGTVLTFFLARRGELLRMLSMPFFAQHRWIARFTDLSC